MKQVRFAGDREIEVDQVETSEPAPGEALVRIVRSAICGSEMPAYRDGTAPKEFANPGHEMVGTIEAGNGLERFAVGNRVGITVLSGCGLCRYCVEGDPKHCTEGALMALDAHSEYVTVRESNLQLLIDDIDWDSSVLLCGDTCGTPFRAIEQIGGVRSKQTAAVFGCGPIGLGCIAWLSYFGVSVICSEPIEYRRKLALSVGATNTVNPTVDDAAEFVRDFTSGGADLCFDCSEHETTAAASLDSVAIGGRVAFIGEKAKVTIQPSAQIIHKEIHISGSWYFTAADYHREVYHFQRGFDPRGLITHRFHLDDAANAYRLFESGETGKVLFEPND